MWLSFIKTDKALYWPDFLRCRGLKFCRIKCKDLNCTQLKFGNNGGLFL